jgi:four helix bundle protein
MMPYEKLRAWERCHALALEVYRATRSFPKSEVYGLSSQMRRAAFSAAANIAEGSAKRGPREFRRFLDISLGSLAEVSYAIRFARELEYVDRETGEKLDNLRQEAGRLTWGLYRMICTRNRLNS